MFVSAPSFTPLVKSSLPKFCCFNLFIFPFPVYAALTKPCVSWCGYRRDDSSFEREPLPTEPPAKRVCTISPAPRHSPALSIPMLNPGGQFHPTPPPLQHYTLEDIATSHLYRDPGKMLEHREIRDRHGGLGEQLCRALGCNSWRVP